MVIASDDTAVTGNLEYVVLAHNHEEASTLEDQLIGLLAHHDSLRITTRGVPRPVHQVRHDLGRGRHGQPPAGGDGTARLPLLRARYGRRIQRRRCHGRRVRHRGSHRRPASQYATAHAPLPP
ncbi:hypothetical protein [Streptomyces sp. NPDC016626]|uniref:hypothetical protein n=1 Tax=Streptomyces sp. NPDC016626 TaxID=3364968 RepID=UPI0036F9650C